MSGNTRGYALDISEHLFRLTTESLRIHSNETRRYQTLASLVSERAGAGVTFDHHDEQTLRRHFEAVPTKGSIRIHLTLTKAGGDALIGAKRRLAKRFGTPLNIGDALSVLLLDFVAEHHARRVLEKIMPDDLSVVEDDLVSTAGSDNIISIR